MNKEYQEALNCLRDTKCDEINNCEICSLTSYCGHYQCIKTLQKAIDKSNKYDELLSILEEYNVDLSNIREILVAGNMAQDWRDKAKKYDEKETPKKSIKKNLINSYDYDEQGVNKNKILQCPNCKFELFNEYECIDYTFDYCPNCGQKLDFGR